MTLTQSLTKTLAWLLTIVLLAGSAPHAAFAADGETGGALPPLQSEDSHASGSGSLSGEDEENLTTEPTSGGGESENTTPGGNENENTTPGGNEDPTPGGEGEDPTTGGEGENPTSPGTDDENLPPGNGEGEGETPSTDPTGDEDNENNEDEEDSNDVKDAKGGGLNTMTMMGALRAMMDIMPLASGGATIDMSDPTPPPSGTGWTYANNIYTIANGANVTVTGSNQEPAASQRRLEVARDATATITLNNVTIAGLGAAQSPLTILNGASVTLNLSENSTNMLTAGTGYAGISVPSGADLTINGTGNGTGKLTATGNGTGAGIGGNSGTDAGKIEIKGGTVTAISDGNGAGIGGGAYGSGADRTGGNGGEITISGGTVTANGGYSGGAGIGGGGSGSSGANNSSGGSGGTIIISGGEVTATGGNTGGAGIGGGAKTSSGSGTGGDGGTIKISDGKVTAWGSNTNGGAGIGGGGSTGSGNAGSGGNITISGGEVTANGHAFGAGIGGGGYTNSTGSGAGGEGGMITISGGEVEATGSSGGGAGIGGGTKGAGGTVSITGGTVIAKAAMLTVPAIGAGRDGSGGTVSVDGGFDYVSTKALVRPIPVTPIPDIFYNDTETFAASHGYGYIELVEILTHTITFDARNGSEVTRLMVYQVPPAPIDKPTDPINSDGIFAGWYTDEDCTDEWDFRTPVTENMTLYAKWSIFSVNNVPVENPSVSTIEAAINTALDNASNGGEVTVTGKFINADRPLRIIIPSGKKLIWEADYSGSVGSVPGDYCMIRLQNSAPNWGGEMVISGEGIVKNYGTGDTVYVEYGVKLTVDKENNDDVAITMPRTVMPLLFPTSPR